MKISGLLQEVGRPSGKSATRSPTQGATGSNTKGYVSDRATELLSRETTQSDSRLRSAVQRVLLRGRDGASERNMQVQKL